MNCKIIPIILISESSEDVEDFEDYTGFQDMVKNIGLHNGGDYATDPLDCSKKCLDLNICIYWSYQKSTTLCYFKTSNRWMCYNEPDWISGPGNVENYVDPLYDYDQPGAVDRSSCSET